MKSLFIAVTFVLFLTGCATQQSSLSPAEITEVDMPLYCEGEAQCKDMWERAIYFVSTKSSYKIQNINDNLIETYNPGPYETNLAWRINKKPMGNGRYQILTAAYCANVFGCTPHYLDAILEAKRYIKGEL